MNVKYDYERIVQGILDIGEAMIRCGAENFRLQDSLYRICRSYGFVKYDIFVIPSNIQITAETPEGQIITQIRLVEIGECDFDKLDYLNNLCRKICKEKPDAKEMRRQFEEVMGRPEQKWYTHYAAGILGGTGFAVFFGCDIRDAIIAVIVSIVIVAAGNWLAEREKNLLAYNLILSFIAEMIILLSVKFGFADHEERIMIGIVMLLVSALGAINGMRDVMQRNFISGSLEVMNSMLGAFGIAFGIALAMMLMGNISAEGFDVNNNTVIQLISCTIGCTGYASWFKIRGKKILYSSVGAFLTWGIYLLVYAWYPDNFFAVVVASCFVAGYAFVMSRVNHAPSTVFLTASVFPLMPGARLYYLMYGVVSRNFSMAAEHALVLLETCLGIAFGFIIVDVISRSIMRALGREYHMGKESTVIKKEKK